MNQRTELDLQQMVSLPLHAKVRMSLKRIEEWVSYYGEEKVYVSVSGGKDSLVLLHLVRSLYPEVVGVFCDTGLEYPEIKSFISTLDHIETIYPSMSFRQVIQTYGYPLVSKEVSQVIECVRQNLKDGKETYRMKRIMGTLTDKEGRYSRYNCPKWRFLLDTDIKISNKCCNVMKKQPFKLYEKQTGRKGFIGTRALESATRKQAWMKTGCNGFKSRRPLSKPLSFWTEQDIMQYLYEHQIALCSVYGTLTYDATTGLFQTTGCERTGCMWCAYGCHREASPNRFEQMQHTHPEIYEYIMRPTEKGGLGYRAIFELMNAQDGVSFPY